MDQTGKFCARCQRHVLATRPSTNHLLHFFITFLTCGFWVIVWILVSIKIGGWQCTQCGAEGRLLK